MILERSLELTDELINEFIEKNKEDWTDPEQYPKIFEFKLKTFLYIKGLIA